jgi:hypothetical protein
MNNSFLNFENLLLLYLKLSILLVFPVEFIIKIVYIQTFSVTAKEFPVMKGLFIKSGDAYFCRTWGSLEPEAGIRWNCHKYHCR